jgi:hypothetical protein
MQMAHLEWWRRGESEFWAPLISRKLFILRYARYAKNAGISELRYAAGTRSAKSYVVYQTIGTRKNLDLQAPVKLEGGALISVQKPASIFIQTNWQLVRCLLAVPAESRLVFLEAAQKGRIAAQQPEVLVRLGEKQRSHRLAELAWKPKDQPDWLDETAYATQVHPKLASCSISAIAMTLGISLPYAADILAGRRRPHPRHWLALAKLVGNSDVR